MNQKIRFCTSFDGTRIAYATAGTGPPLVRVANWLTHLELDWEGPIWSHWFEELSRNHRLVRYDLRGSGLSDRSVDDLSLDAWVRDLEAVVDDLGRAPVRAPDGHQVTWGEWSDVDGSISVTCREEGTRVELDLSGLIPHGVYTVWNVTFEAPGFTGEFDALGLPANVKAFGPAGPSDGSRSMFLASASGEGSFAVTTPPGDLGTTGMIGACALTDEREWHVVGLYHVDGKTYGPERGPAGTHAEQFAFVFTQE